jgi:glucose/arabinose dehydrogenase
MIPRVSTGSLLAGTLCLLAATASAQQTAPAPAASAPTAATAPQTPAALPPGSPLIGRPEDNAAAAKLAPVPSPPLATPADKIAIDRLKAPKGFNIELYASGMPNARSLALGDKGTIFVGSRLQDKIYAIVNKNGKREVKVLVSGLYRPNGVAFRNGTLYIAELSQISKIDNVEDKLDSSPKPTVIYSDLPKDEAHGWKFLAIGPDNRLYFNIGAPCNICMPPPTNAQLRSIATDGSDPQIIAHGIRQVVGMDFDPNSKVLYFTENQRDWLSEDAPQDKLNRLLNPEKTISAFPIATAAISRIRNSDGVTPAANSPSRWRSLVLTSRRSVCASIPAARSRRSITMRSSLPGTAPGIKPTNLAVTSTSSISTRTAR